MPWMESKNNQGGEEGGELSIYGVQERTKTSINMKRVTPNCLIVVLRL